MPVTDYSTDPAANTFLGTIPLSEGATNIGQMNNGLRQIMADVRVMYDNMPSAAALQTKAAAVFSGTEPIYNGRGAYLHWNNPALSSGRVYIQPIGGSMPAGALPGAIVFEY